MKYYRLKESIGKIEEIKGEDISFDMKPAKMYFKDNVYYGVGEVSKKFLRIIEEIMNERIEEYWDKDANKWMEKLEDESN